MVSGTIGDIRRRGILMPSRRFLTVVAVLVVGLVLTGCDDDLLGDGVRGSGNVVTESRVVSGFDEIVLLGSGDVIVSVTGTESLTIEAEDNILPLLTSEVRDGRLELGSDSSFSTSEGITYTITAADFDGLTIRGSADVVASGIDSDSFDATVTGSGDIDAAGTTEDLTVRISGSGDFRGVDLTATTADVDISGSGSVVVNASDELDVSIRGSGDVEYIGNPALTQNITGSGSISPR